MLQMLPVAFPQVNATNTSEVWLNKIRQTVYFLYQAKKKKKKHTQKVCSNIIKSK